MIFFYLVGSIDKKNTPTKFGIENCMFPRYDHMMMVKSTHRYVVANGDW